MMSPDAPGLRIALLEDDAPYGELLKSWLTAAGHTCYWEQRAAPFTRLLSRETFDLVVLDWQVPDRSGEEVLRWIRTAISSPVPVLFVTSRDSETDVAHILERGADDYLAKPVRKLEFLARVRAIARRGQGTPAKDLLVVGNLRADPRAETISRDGVAVDLAPKEFAIAALFLRNLGRLMSRGQIYEAVWGRAAPDSLRTVDTHVSQVRTKLGLVAPNGWKLSSVYQHGYRLERLGAGGTAEDASTTTDDDG